MAHIVLEDGLDLESLERKVLGRPLNVKNMWGYDTVGDMSFFRAEKGYCAGLRIFPSSSISNMFEESREDAREALELGLVTLINARKNLTIPVGTYRNDPAEVKRLLIEFRKLAKFAYLKSAVKSKSPDFCVRYKIFNKGVILDPGS